MLDWLPSLVLFQQTDISGIPYYGWFAANHYIIFQQTEIGGNIMVCSTFTANRSNGADIMFCGNSHSTVQYFVSASAKLYTVMFLTGIEGLRSRIIVQ